ncbi:MAG: hypothetical protein ACON4E_07105 [Flavobacteriales bacterium]
MIISHQYKFVFVGLPLAASTAISKELCEMYGGKPILSKHSIYQDFLKVASEEEKSYKVIACSRNPLDISVSYYTKMIKDASGNFSNENLLRKNGGHLKNRDYKLAKYFRNNGANYTTFLKKYYQFPFDNWFSITKPYCDYIIRFDHLQVDFESALKICGIKPKRKLPMVNKTSDKASYLSYYTTENNTIGLAIFGPYLKEHQMTFPKEWKKTSVSLWHQFVYRLMRQIRKLFWKYNSYRDTNAQKVYKELLEKHQ